MRGVVTIGIALLLPAIAAAKPVPPRWVAVGTHVDGGVVEVDAAHITSAGGITRGWWRIALAEVRADGTAREQNLDAIDCAQHLTTQIEQIRYDSGGQVLDHSRESEDVALRRLSAATPGTTGETADRMICRLRPKR